MERVPYRAGITCSGYPPHTQHPTGPLVPTEGAASVAPTKEALGL